MTGEPQHRKPSMSLDHSLTQLLGGLYEAVYDRDKWPSAMAEFTRHSQSRMAVVCSIDLSRPAFVGLQSHGPNDRPIESVRGEYAKAMHAHDPALNWARDHPAAGMCETAAIIPSADYREHPFIKWTRRHFGTLYWRFFYTEPVDGLSFGLSFHAAADRGPPARKLLPLQALLFENLERAVRLAARPPDFAADGSALIAIDAAGRPLALSQRADEIVREADAVTVSHGVLGARSEMTDRLLQQAIRAAVDLSSGELPGRGVRISRSAGKSDLLAIVSHFPPVLDHLPRPVPAALVRLIELDQRPTSLSQRAHLFDLSPRETEVATGLLGGHSIESLSAALGISRNTVRNHVQALFRKTRTNRQPDLMRVLDRIARE